MATENDRKAAEASVRATLGQMKPDDRARFAEVVTMMANTSKPIRGVQRVKKLTDAYIKSARNSSRKK